MRIVVFTPLPCLDRYVNVSAHPSAGAKVLGHWAGEWCGGVAGNFAVAMARLGASVHAFGWAGDDSSSRRCVAALAAADVNVDMISTHAGLGVSRTVILVDPAGERSVIAFPADQPSLPDETWHPALARLRPNLCYFASWGEVARELAPTVKAAGGLVATTLESTALETNSLDRAHLPPVDILFLSCEAATVLGWSASSQAAVPAGWRHGPPVIVVTLGSGGAWYHMPLVSCTGDT